VDLGIFGLVLFFMVLIPFAVFEAYFWSGMGFRKGPIPTPQVRLAAFWNAFLWVVAHQLWCFFVVPAMLLWHGRRQVRKLRRNNRGKREQTMNSRIILFIALVSSGGLFACKPRPIPSPPNAEQVRAWAEFPAGFQLQTTSNSLSRQDKESQAMFGKPIWACEYKNAKRSLESFEIIVSQRGTLWGTNRTQMTKTVEKQIALMRPFKNRDEDSKKLFQIISLPNGRTAYFTALGFGPGGAGLVGFSYDSDYDLIVMENIDFDDVPVEMQMKNPVSPTNDLAGFFGKLEKYLEAQ
jgi:hypothetical protein